MTEGVRNNSLSLWGNKRTMNLDNSILAGILSSHYFKGSLGRLITCIQVVDEIYPVKHLEPWEAVSGESKQTDISEEVKEVVGDRNVSRAFCILFKLFTLKLTRRQVQGLIKHMGSPYIRAIGFMYIRYTQPPSELWDWYEDYLDDKEVLDVKAGTGQPMTIGEMLLHFLSKTEWFSTSFPPIPEPVQHDLEIKLCVCREEIESFTPLSPEVVSLFQYIQDLYKNNWNYGVYINNCLLDAEDPGENADERPEDLDELRGRRRSEGTSKFHGEHSADQPNHSNHRVRSRSPIHLKTDVSQPGTSKDGSYFL